ncbi:Regulator of chromosome condensation (RCC1) repeat [seawater metagenome]|uniref:Regulator of chromosome condensation (RCC1) repeat n=1 Tax=seawater metagenome TaxID=1561972 RepID=A0A5E8CFS7_9ZZZZ
MNNLNLTELNNTPLIIKALGETIVYILTFGYDHNIDKAKFIQLCKSIKNAGGKELWTKDCAKMLGQIIKLIKKFNNLKELVNGNLERELCGNLITCGETKLNFESLDIKVKKIKAGGNHCAFLTDDNKFFTMGSNSFGQIGNNSEESCYQEPYLHDQYDKVIHFCCGYSFTAVINNDELYSWGAGENGRLGHGDTEDCKIPKKVNIDFIPKSVEGGSTIMIILGKDGKLYSCGQKKYSGHPNAEQDILIPKLIKFSENNRVSKIQLGHGGYHALALTKSNKLYTWGHNRVGQLGLEFLGNTCDNGAESDDENSDDNVIRKPTLVKSVGNLLIKDISAGWGHSMLLTFDNQVYVCGRNRENQLGINQNICKLNINDMLYIDKFTNIDQINIKSISAGGITSFLTDFENNLTIFGMENISYEKPEQFRKLMGCASDVFFYI